MTEKEMADALVALTGETMALQLVVSGILHGLVKGGMSDAAHGALDYADAIIDVGALKFGEQGRAAHTAKMIEVVEGLRQSIS